MTEKKGSHGGKRSDIGVYVRSTWEANIYRYFRWLKESGSIKDFQYEADEFWFEGIKRGTRSYKPDFKVTNNDGSIEYHEVKGYMDSKSATQLKRMAKYHPEVKIFVIGRDEYKAIKKFWRMIEGWED